MTNAIDNIDHTNEQHKLSAEEVMEACPTMLQNWGVHIAAHLEKARKYEDKAKQHYTAVGEYLARAKKACDDGGFTAFREKFSRTLAGRGPLSCFKSLQRRNRLKT